MQESHTETHSQQPRQPPSRSTTQNSRCMHVHVLHSASLEQHGVIRSPARCATALFSRRFGDSFPRKSTRATRSAIVFQRPTAELQDRARAAENPALEPVAGREFPAANLYSHFRSAAASHPLRRTLPAITLNTPPPQLPDLLANIGLHSHRKLISEIKPPSTQNRTGVAE